MDGRRETVYSSTILANHQMLWNAEPSARSYLDSLQADFVWIPSTLPLYQQLDAWGWRKALETPTSAIWTRSKDVRIYSPDETPQRCFPSLK